MFKVNTITFTFIIEAFVCASFLFCFLTNLAYRQKSLSSSFQSGTRAYPYTQLHLEYTEYPRNGTIISQSTHLVSQYNYTNT